MNLSAKEALSAGLLGRDVVQGAAAFLLLASESVQVRSE
jgi:hypothetical protein